MPSRSDDDQKFARAVQKTSNGKVAGLDTEMKGLIAPLEEPKSGGSDDIGDVSWVAPTITINYPSNIPNLPGHHWANAMSMATPIAHKGVVTGAKVVGMTALDLLTSADLLKDAKAYFNDVQLKDQKYLPVLSADDKPQIQKNTEIMDKFRPQMSKFYYDPSKYTTYLEQLGVKYPEIEH